MPGMRIKNNLSDFVIKFIIVWNKVVNISDLNPLWIAVCCPRHDTITYGIDEVKLVKLVGKPHSE